MGKANEAIVQAAVQQNGNALQFASDELRGELESRSIAWGLSIKEYATAISKPVIVNVLSIVQFADSDLEIKSGNCGGDEVSIRLDPRKQNSTRFLRERLATRLDENAASLILVLPNGRVCKFDTEAELVE